MILVTGGAGYIGSHYVLYERERGNEVVVLDNLVYGHKEAVLDTPLVIGDLAKGFRKMLVGYPPSLSRHGPIAEMWTLRIRRERDESGREARRPVSTGPVLAAVAVHMNPRLPGA